MELIARGLSNQEIADAAFLSLNSVKTHVRTAYRKVGVTHRSQVVGWVLRHGFASEGTRDRRTTGGVGEWSRPGLRAVGGTRHRLSLSRRWVVVLLPGLHAHPEVMLVSPCRHGSCTPRAPAPTASHLVPGFRPLRGSPTGYAVAAASWFNVRPPLFRPRLGH